MTNIAAMAAAMLVDLTARALNGEQYPTHDEQSGIGQLVCVRYVGPTNEAPSRITGVVVSRIITDRSGGPRHGEKWVLVEWGDGPPWSPCALSNLLPLSCSEALRDFPTNGVATVERMLGRDD